MGKKKNKGFITWVATLSAMIIAVIWGSVLLGLSFALPEGGFKVLSWEFILFLLTVLSAFYFITHGVLILLGVARNNWGFVIIGFFTAAIIGGVLLLVAKIID